MIYCEPCRVKNKWFRSPGFPLVGFKINAKCEVCGTLRDCHDQPASMLTPLDSQTSTEQAVYKMMQEGYKIKAESLKIMTPSGRIDHLRNSELQEIVIRVGKTIDWYTTYQLRLVAQENINRRTH